MVGVSAAQLEEFVNNVLREDLKYLEQHLNRYNEEITEFVQLKHTISAIQEDLPSPFKTQMNIGGNVFMEAQVDNTNCMLVDVGKGYFLEFTPEEALKFVEFKLKVLNKECDVVRQESIKKRADIKVALMYLADQQKLYQQESN